MKNLKKSNPLIEEDINIFLRDYSQYAISGESKPQAVGTPFFLHSSKNKGGVVLIHGYMAAPEEMRQLAEKIHKSGYAVYAVRLRGHGTAPEDLSRRTWQEWNASIHRACGIMEQHLNNFVVAGFSTGAGLALLQAEENPEKFKGMISISAPIKIQDWRSKFSGFLNLYNKILKTLHIKWGTMEFIPNEPDNPKINYLRNPIAGVHQIERLMKKVKRRLRKIICPALIIQGDQDPTVSPKGAEKIYANISSSQKELILVESSKHCIIRDEKLEEIYPHIEGFLREVLK